MANFKKWQIVNRYYKITKFYVFLKNIVIKGIITIIAIVALLLILHYFFIDINALLTSLVENYSTGFVLTFFFITETILGLIPPDIFIAWAAKKSDPLMFLGIISIISYLGGITAYLIGQQLYRVPSIKNHIENKIAIHIKNLRRWGGFLIFVGAMLPIPHAVVSMACGLIKFSFKQYLLWALFRFLRFALYALVVFQIF